MNPSTAATAKTPKEAAYHCCAENMYRREPSGSYYAVVKRAGKQIWRSLKTGDRKLAERRLADFVSQAAQLRPQEEPHIAFPTLAERWLDTRRHTIKPSTLARAQRCGTERLPTFGRGFVSFAAGGREACFFWATFRSSESATASHRSRHL